MIDTHLLQQSFASRFGGEAAVFFAPGRINLIGEHTDYNGGFVFPGAVTQGISAAIRPNGKPTVNLYAADLGRACSFEPTDDEGPSDTHFRYVYGVVRELKAAGVEVQGFDAVYGGDVPLGAGMSSSAALESCFAYALCDLFGGHLDRMTLARIGQATEHKYVGVKCGIMDQFASMHAREGALMRLDCRSGQFEYFPWHPDGYRLVLVNSCVKHELVGSPYNERRASCERVAALAGVDTLRDCTLEKLSSLHSKLSAQDYRRARYVLGEVERVIAVGDALGRGDYEEVGRQMYLTHEGLSRDYEVSCPELDFLVDEARRLGVSGARLMGGGFGGCTVNLVRNERYDVFLEEMQRTYRARFGVACQPIPVVIGDGARRLF
ncbi:MAG: galactokinase [Bacteroidales bacterium]|nr:galactokinase [Bacteroidales bacterium]